MSRTTLIPGGVTRCVGHLAAYGKRHTVECHDGRTLTGIAGDFRFLAEAPEGIEELFYHQIARVVSTEGDADTAVAMHGPYRRPLATDDRIAVAAVIVCLVGIGVGFLLSVV